MVCGSASKLNQGADGSLRPKWVHRGGHNLEETVLNFHLSQVQEQGNQWVMYWRVPVLQRLGYFFSLLGYVAGNIQQSEFWSCFNKTWAFCSIKGYFALFFKNWELSSSSWVFCIQCASAYQKYRFKAQKFGLRQAINFAWKSSPLTVSCVHTTAQAFSCVCDRPSTKNTTPSLTMKAKQQGGTEPHWEKAFASTTLQCETSSAVASQCSQGTGNDPAANTFWVQDQRERDSSLPAAQKDQGAVLSPCIFKHPREECQLLLGRGWIGLCRPGNRNYALHREEERRPEALNISPECI